MADGPDITEILGAVARAEDGAEAQLFDVVHGELRAQAVRQVVGRNAAATLAPTALVNEAYLRLFGATPPAFENRRHFFFAAARAMRDVAVEYARRQGAQRRGGGRRRVALDDEALGSEQELSRILDVDEALRELADHDPDSAEVVLLRYFGGLTIPQTAETLGIPESRVRREWEFARAWLGGRLGGGS